MSFVPCGPAVFGRPDPLPHAACAKAYMPLAQISWTLLGLGGLATLAGLVLLVQRFHAPRESMAG